MVFFHHACFTDLNPAQWGRGVRILYLFSSVGMRGVDIFFVLSSFLITSLLIKDRTSPSFYQDFYWKRALRILPRRCWPRECLYGPDPGARTLVRRDPRYGVHTL